MSFSEFVAIKLSQVSDRTIDYKAISSFISSTRGYEDLNLEDLLRVWIAAMIDRGFTVASRKRYIGKLGTIYKEYCAGQDIDGNPFESVRELRNFDDSANIRELQAAVEKIEKIFDTIMSDANIKPHVALFLYLLFNVSSDLEKAISLTIDEYTSEFPQLDDIIKPAEFHHRRKYVFDLGQSHKRMPQLVREVTAEINSYFRARDIRLPDAFTPRTIISVWAAKARKTGVTLSDLRSLLRVIPDEYVYLKYVKGSELTPEETKAIKRRVAEAFSPSCRRWYAIKLRRSTIYDTFQTYIRDHFQDYYDDRTLFYPQMEISRRFDKKIVTESVPVIPDVVFINVLPRHVRTIDHLIRSRNFGGVLRMANTSDSGFSVISHQSMLIFQRMIGIFTPEMRMALTKDAPVGIGREVRITGGIMAGYTGRIYDIKEGSDVRQIYIRLSSDYSVRAEIKVEEYFVEPLDKQSITA